MLERDLQTKKMKYELVDGVWPQDFVDDVNNLISKGWEPLGGVCAASGEYGRIFLIQSMVKRGGEDA